MLTTTAHTPNGDILYTTTTVQSPQASSVEITMDAKGQAKPCVKVYHEDPEQAASQALALYRQLVAALAQA
jgi:hypothetical protein